MNRYPYETLLSTARSGLVAIVMSAACITMFAHAQEVPAQPNLQMSQEAPVSSSEIEQTLPPSESSSEVAPQSGEPVIQDTVGTQDAVAGDVLEATRNPSDVVVEEIETVPVPDTEDMAPVIVVETAETATSSETESSPITDEEPIVIAGPASLEIIDEDIVAEDVINPDVVDEIVPLVVDVVVVLEEEKLIADPTFAIELTGTTIPTIKTDESLGAGAEVVRSTIETDIDTEGVMNLSGVCTEAYYVVLLFKEKDDYDRDPRSYILNKAYPCESGQFTYALEQLPSSLPTGTYYLLIGSQGERGGWTPVTALTEVTINRSN